MITLRLKHLRQKNGLSQSIVARHLCITRPSYTMYETGMRMPDIHMLVKLADFYQVNTDYLLGRTDKPDMLPPSQDKGRGPYFNP